MARKEKSAEFASWLRSSEPTKEEFALFTGLLLDKLEAISLRDIIYQDQDSQSLIVRGTPIDFQIAADLQNSASAALENRALSLIREQVEIEAVTQATSKARTLDELIFYRAALWWGLEVQKKLEILAQRQPEA